MSITGDVTKEFLSQQVKERGGKDNLLPTLTMARLLYNKNKEVYNSIDHARTSLRTYLGQKGEHNRKKIKDKSMYSKPAAMANKYGIGNPFSLPKSSEEIWEPYFMPPRFKALVLSDIHIPYHDIPALSEAFNKGLKEGVNCVILNGDIIDCYQLSRFTRDPRKRSFKEELDITKDFIKTLKKTFNMPIYFKIGNHEERYENYMLTKAPELLDIQEYRLENLLKFGEYGIQLIEDQRIIKAGSLNIMHGHEFGRSVFSPVNPARGYYMKSKTNTICGHNHQTSEHTEPNLNEDVVTVWSTGCLCGLHPKYMRVNKWNHGFAIIEAFEDGSYEVDNYRVIEGKIR